MKTKEHKESNGCEKYYCWRYALYKINFWTILKKLLQKNDFRRFPLFEIFALLLKTLQKSQRVQGLIACVEFTTSILRHMINASFTAINKTVKRKKSHNVVFKLSSNTCKADPKLLSSCSKALIWGKFKHRLSWFHFNLQAAIN